MTYNSIKRILEAVHEPMNEYEAMYIINGMLYGDSSSDKNMIGARINPDYVQRLLDEFLKNVKSIDGILRAEIDDKGTGVVILKGETPIFYRGRFLKDQFDNEAMISLLHANSGNGTEKIFEDRIVTRNYIIGENGLYENRNAYTSFIDSMRQLEDPNLEQVDLQYYYYPNSEQNTRLFIDRVLGCRIVEKKLGVGLSEVQEFRFDQEKFSIPNLQNLRSKYGTSLTNEELYNEVYSPVPVTTSRIRPDYNKVELVSPKVYEKY